MINAILNYLKDSQKNKLANPLAANSIKIIGVGSLMCSPKLIKLVLSVFNVGGLTLPTYLEYSWQIGLLIILVGIIYHLVGLRLDNKRKESLSLNLENNILTLSNVGGQNLEFFNMTIKVFDLPSPNEFKNSEQFVYGINKLLKEGKDIELINFNSERNLYNAIFSFFVKQQSKSLNQDLPIGVKFYLHYKSVNKSKPRRIDFKRHLYLENNNIYLARDPYELHRTTFGKRLKKIIDWLFKPRKSYRVRKQFKLAQNKLD